MRQYCRWGTSKIDWHLQIVRYAILDDLDDEDFFYAVDYLLEFAVSLQEFLEFAVLSCF